MFAITSLGEINKVSLDCAYFRKLLRAPKIDLLKSNSGAVPVLCKSEQTLGRSK